MDYKLDISKLMVRANRPLTKAVYAEQSPIIDGKLDDLIWQRADKIDAFRTMYGDKPSAETIGYAAYDDKYLFFALQCMEPNMHNIKDTIRKHDGAVWKDDSIEVFIDTNKDRKTYYQLIVNAAGTTYDGQGYDRSYEIKAKTAVFKKADSWIVEGAIPWRNLNIPAPDKGDIMGFFLVRTRTQKNEKQQFPVLYGGNHQPDLFGDLLFE